MADSVVLGRPITGPAGRDAVHVAVAPMTAGHVLWPGNDVGLGADGRVYLARDGVEPIGIVDPFLREQVQEGQRFWLCLYPNTITGLRHVWTHPAFATKVPVVKEKL